MMMFQDFLFSPFLFFFHSRHGHEIYFGSEIISLIFGHRYIQTHLPLGFQTTIPKDEDSSIIFAETIRAKKFRLAEALAPLLFPCVSVLTLDGAAFIHTEPHKVYAWMSTVWKLGGGFNFLKFHPEPWGRDPI